MNLSSLKKAEFIKTLELNLFTDRTVLLDNEPYSKSTYIIKSLDFSNSSSASRTITVWFVRNGVYYDLMTDFVIPAKASINALGNDITLYLERGDSIVAISSVTDNTVKAICNYVQISDDVTEPMDKSYINLFPKTLDVFDWANAFTPTNMTLSRDIVNVSPVGVSPLSINITSSSSSLNSFNTFASNINLAFKDEKWLVEFYAQSNTPTDFTLEVYGAFANGNTDVTSDFFTETFSVTQAWKKYKLEVDFVENETSFIQVNFKGSTTLTTVRIDNLRVQRIGQAISGFNVIGGTEAIVDGVKYHTFNSTDQIFVAGSKLVDVVLVAGGGGGGMAFASTPRHAGGGGAGGLRQLQTTVNSGAYNVVIGAGGSGSTNINNQGSDGNDSSIFGFSSTGGGGGGSTNVPREGRSGGSGGGGARNGTTFAAGGAGTDGQGFSGATSTSSGSGGGGGAGGAGTVTSGGAGVSFNGSTYAVGGNGTNTSVNTAGTSAGSNTGSGGGGGSTGGIGGNGGSGIIIVYYEV
jgi:hypothetical protein